jgi:hypothetical protein
MTDDDLIRRGDALNICTRFPYPEGIATAIAALPAVTAPQGVDGLEAENARLRDQLRLIELLGYREGEQLGWLVAHMRGVANDALEGRTSAHMWRLFPKHRPAALAPAQPALTPKPVDDSLAADPAVKPTLAEALAVTTEEAFMSAVWDALKADASDLRKQQRILNAFRAALRQIGGEA